MIQALVVDDVRAMVDSLCRMLALLDVQADSGIWLAGRYSILE